MIAVNYMSAGQVVSFYLHEKSIVAAKRMKMALMAAGHQRVEIEHVSPYPAHGGFGWAYQAKRDEESET